MKYCICCWLLLLSLFYNGKAQPYYFRHYQVENGLSNNAVFCSIQDKEGFLWFGTKDGLNRFDGYHFKLFNIIDNNENTLSKDLITALALDANGVLWVGCQKGIYRFDATTEQLVPFIDSLHYIGDLLFDAKGRLWFTSDLVAGYYDFKSQKTITFPSADYFSATALCLDDTGQVWLATATGYLQCYNETAHTFTAYNVFTHSPPSASRWIEIIKPGPGHTLFVGTSSQGIKQYNITTQQYKDLLLYNHDGTTVYVRDILAVTGEEYWFATEAGIFVYHTDSGQFTHIRKRYLDAYSLSDNAVYSLYKDLEGGIWAGTFFGGVNYYPKQYSVFQKYYPDYTKNSISGNVVREICKDHQGNLWIGTEDAGLNKLDTKTGTVTHFLPSGSQNCIAYTNIHGLLVVNNELWIGTFEHGLDVMNILTGKIKRHYTAGPKKSQLKSNFIVSLLQTKRGEIYVGSSNQLFIYLPATDNFQPVSIVPERVFVSCLLEDSEGTIWIGTHNSGLYFFNPQTKESGHLENDPNNKNSLTTNTINAIYEDRLQQIWLATEGGGLCCFNKQKKTFSNYSTKNGLPSNFVFKILEDDQHTLWATTSKGLVHITEKGTTIYTQSNGLLNDQFNYNSGYKDEAGTLYFGSVKGMIRFKPDEFVKSSYTPPVTITGFQVNNKEVAISMDSSLLQQSILQTRHITLPHNQSSFSIDFAAINFTSPEMTEYQYKMEGLDKEWTLLKSNRKVYFTNLSPGNYIFKIKAASNGLWNTHARKLVISVLPPYWATTWAYLIYILITLLVLYYLVKVYHEKLHAKKEKEVYEAKLDFFTKVAHEIRTPLTLIKGPVENLVELTNELPQIKEDVILMEKNTDRLLKLMNQVLDFRQTEAQNFSLDFTQVNLTELMKETYLNFQSIAKKKKLSYTINLPNQEVNIWADAEAVQKIISNLFANAVKYAEHKVQITLLPVNKDKTDVQVLIQNDGFVIPEDLGERIFEPFYRLKETARQKGTGIGLALARSLAQLHSGTLHLAPPLKGVNTFVLRLPINEKIEHDKIKTIRQKPLLKT